jgi:ATP-binding cassette subfamily B protein
MSGKVRFDHVTFTYPYQEEPALMDVNFRVRPGEKVAIMGPSGSGKSTIFQLLLRFYDPQQGEVRVGGVNLIDAATESIRWHVGMVQQEPVIFSGTLAENIMYGRLAATPSEVIDACKKAEMHDFIMSLPLKYETVVGEQGITLSGGQRQRLALAQALLTDPEILLLDDTTSALDARTEARIRETLNKALEGRTSLIITQRVATARDSDWIMVLENGRATQMGTHEQLKSREGFYRRICEQQDAL